MTFTKNKKKKKYVPHLIKLYKKKFKVNTKVTNFNKYHLFVKTKNVPRIGNFVSEINNYLNKKKSLNYYQYRLPYRKMYFNYLQLTTGLKLKYLIQDFVQKYFSIQVEAKIIHVLNTYKNKNYFRLVFPVKKKNKQLIKKFWIKKKKKEIFLTPKLYLATPVKKYTNVNLKKKLLNENSFKLLKKKNLFLLAKKKKKRHIKNYFDRIRKNKEFKQIFKFFIPTLMDFSRNLEPQLLADIIAKVIHKAKKQTWMLSSIKYILDSIDMKSNVGYKIALSGRINSTDKSRLICITRKQITLQVFENNMNFAYAQANARIGTFGVKIWVYSKKKV